MNPNLSKGVIVGCNATLEWLLPFFYLNFRLHCDLPLTFFDFGMTAMGRQFCEKRGNVIELHDTLWSLSTNESTYHKSFAYFQKPLACKQAPYDLNLWLDIDCQVNKSIDAIFTLLTEDKWLVIREEFTAKVQVNHINFTKIPIFNSGVFVFKKEAPFIDLWIELCLKHPLQGLGDQDILSFELFNHPLRVGPLPEAYNHLIFYDPLGPTDQAHILHYQAHCKEVLLNHFNYLETLKEAVYV